jgi:hypothetical protein
VLIFNPKILALLALMGFGSLILMGPRQRTLKAPKAAVVSGGAAAARTLKTHTDEFDALKQASRLKAEGRAAPDAFDSRPPPPPKEEEFSIDLLIRAMKEGMAGVPEYVPNLPFMVSLARSMLAADPNSIRVAPMPQGTLGEFDWNDRNHLQIRLSPDLKRLHQKGVPARLLAPVLVHELDHMLGYLYRRKHPGETRHNAEQSAFRSQGLYVFGLSLRGKGPDNETVEATDYDPEKKAYMDELRKLRKTMLSGELPQFIKERYGGDDDVLKREERR